MRYDRRYFDRWYRNPDTRVRDTAELRRTAALAVAVTEQLLARPIRSVLDIGCGEGRWAAALRRMRPRVQYLGLDPSGYAVQRFGTRRNLRRGGLESLAELGGQQFDLIVCADVLHYVPDRQVAAGVTAIAERALGAAYLEVYTSRDRLSGDVAGLRRRSPQWYRRAFRGAGLIPLGLHCYAAPAVAEALGALEAGR